MYSLRIENINHFVLSDLGLPSDVETTFSVPLGRQRYFIVFININLVISVSAVVYCQAHNNGFKA